MQEDCLFCKIIDGQIPSEKVYEDAYVYAFKDISPQAPFHALVIPKTHIDSLAHVTDDNAGVGAHCLCAIAKIAEANDLGNGFRVISNVGGDGGQTVFHLHFHVLGGEKLKEKLL